MQKKKTQKQFEKELLEVAGSEYVVVSEYTTIRGKIKVEHIPCGTILERVAGDFLRRNRRPRCTKCLYKSQTKTTDWFKQKIYEACGNDYKVLGEYVTAKTKVSMLHTKCGKAWDYSPDNFLRRGSRCPYCSKNAKRDTNSFKQVVNESHYGEYTILGKYVNAHTKILCRHNTCGFEWEVKPDSLIREAPCPKCAESQGERLVREILTNAGIAFIPQKSFEGCKYKKVLYFDFYLPDYNCCIEYDGLQHFKPVAFNGEAPAKAEELFKVQQKRDAVKNNFCSLNDIALLRIPYSFSTIEVNNAITDFLKL